jgi:hypothetical protein
MQRALCVFFFCMLFLYDNISAQTLNSSWKKDLESSLQEFMDCQTKNNGVPCLGYVGKVLSTIYKVNDFYSAHSNRYMTTTEISSFLKASEQWVDLGKPYDQKTLQTAQEYANAKRAVVAVYQNSQGMGHVVVITPGQLLPSGSWGLNVPNAASFFAMEPQKSFTEKALSFAFAKNMIKDVTIYGRNY